MRVPRSAPILDPSPASDDKPLPVATRTAGCPGAEEFRKDQGMNRFRTRLVAVMVVIAAGGLAAGCGQGGKAPLRALRSPVQNGEPHE